MKSLRHRPRLFFRDCSSLADRPASCKKIDHGDESYLLSGGKWYQVARNFVDKVNASFERIDRIDLALPEYDDDSEGKYLKRVRAGWPKRLFRLNGSKVHLPWTSPKQNGILRSLYDKQRLDTRK